MEYKSHMAMTHAVFASSPSAACIRPGSWPGGRQAIDKLVAGMAPHIGRGSRPPDLAREFKRTLRSKDIEALKEAAVDLGYELHVVCYADCIQQQQRRGNWRSATIWKSLDAKASERR